MCMMLLRSSSSLLLPCHSHDCSLVVLGCGWLPWKHSTCHLHACVHSDTHAACQPSLPLNPTLCTCSYSTAELKLASCVCVCARACVSVCVCVCVCECVCVYVHVLMVANWGDSSLSSTCLWACERSSFESIFPPKEANCSIRGIGYLSNFAALFIVAL